MGKKRIYKESRRVSRRDSTLHGGGSNHDAKQDSQLPSYLYRMRVRRFGRRPERTRRGDVARMPLTALVADTPYEEWPTELPPYMAQPWDCMSHTHSVYKIERASPAPWIAKVDGEFYPAKYYFTVDYTDNEVADDPAQHKQSHVLELLDAGEYTGNMVALPNNRVRVTHPAWFETGEGAPDFKPNQHTYNSKEDVEYVWDTQRVFNNLYSEE